MITSISPGVLPFLGDGVIDWVPEPGGTYIVRPSTYLVGQIVEVSVTPSAPVRDGVVSPHQAAGMVRFARVLIVICWRSGLFPIWVLYTFHSGVVVEVFYVVEDVRGQGVVVFLSSQKPIKAT